MSRTIRQSTFIAAVMLLSACASTGTGGSGSGDPGVLTSEQLIATNEPNPYNAVQRLRSAWLRPRGQTSVSGGANTVTLFVDGAPRGDVSNLRNMNMNEIRDIQYLSASEAAFRFGTIAGSNGTVVVRTQG